ncbi:MmgE/PrpD family protein [Agromyces silvae]|uniref:MmgE/PrpD family protein n=1 Tax=Agromyces silvae TaxID=3388266 RepID=UPI00280BCA46|nr:MmgE/PrpD family protein [Agromyces protaetiae]
MTMTAFGEITEGAPPPVEIEQIADQLVAFARAASRVELDEVPQQTRDHAALVIADTIGVIKAGAEREEFRALMRDEHGLFGTAGGGAAQTAFDPSRRVSPAAAAFMNGSAGNAPEMHELIEGGGMGGHPAVHIVPAALAVAQTLHSSGRDLLRAFIAGYEVDARLFHMLRLHEAVHPHGNVAAVGAAVAVATLLGSDAGQAALMASSLPLLSLWEAGLEGATVQHAYTGIGASMGVVANAMASAGLVGSRRAFAIAYTGVMGELVDRGGLDHEFDPKHLLIEQNLTKQYSCCARAFPAVHATLGVEAVDLGSVRRIVARVDPLALRMTGRGDPRTSLAARFSLEYSIATALVHGHADPSAFDDLRPDAVALARLVEVEIVPAFAGASGIAGRQAEIEVVDASGSHRGAATGGHLDGQSGAAAFSAKFEALTGELSHPLNDRALDALRDLERVPDVYDLLG